LIIPHKNEIDAENAMFEANIVGIATVKDDFINPVILVKAFVSKATLTLDIDS
jgi:hypothetical protein